MVFIFSKCIIIEIVTVSAVKSCKLQPVTERVNVFPSATGGRLFLKVKVLPAIGVIKYNIYN